MGANAIARVANGCGVGWRGGVAGGVVRVSRGRCGDVVGVSRGCCGGVEGLLSWFGGNVL